MFTLVPRAAVPAGLHAATVSAPRAVRHDARLATPTACSARSSPGTSPPTWCTRPSTTVAFRDLEPQAPTHVLVIPRSHYAERRRARPPASPDALRRPRRRRRRRSPSRRASARATGWSSTPAPAPTRPCSTPTCTCSAAARWAGRRDEPPRTSLRTPAVVVALLALRAGRAAAAAAGRHVRGAADVERRRADHDGHAGPTRRHRSRASRCARGSAWSGWRCRRRTRPRRPTAPAPTTTAASCSTRT